MATIFLLISRAYINFQNCDLNRANREYQWSASAVNERRLKLLREDAQTAPRRSGVLLIDDTFNEKFGEHFEKAGEFYLPAEEHYGWAHNLVTLHYADAVCDYPLELELYEQMDVEQAAQLLREHGGKFKEEVLARKQRDSDRRRYLGPKLRAVEELAEVYPTKIQLACRLVDWAVRHGFRQPFVFDSWYTCKELCRHITGRDRDWIGTTDASEGIYWSGKWHSLGEWVAARPAQEFDLIRFPYRGQGEGYWAGSWVAPVGKLGRVRLLASYQDEEERERGEEPQFYLTGHLTWERKHILQRRRRRSRDRDR
jgi:hypothetical protein